MCGGDWNTNCTDLPFCLQRRVGISYQESAVVHPKRWHTSALLRVFDGLAARRAGLLTSIVSDENRNLNVSHLRHSPTDAMKVTFATYT